MLEKFIKNLQQFGQFLISYFWLLYKQLETTQRGIPLKEMVSDFLAVFRGVIVVFLLNILALIVFVGLPQGKDVILIVTEDLISFQPASLLWLLFGLFLWSQVSEFAGRYAIYVSDNSGKSLSGRRVEWRKALQRAMSGVFLTLPYFIVLLAFVINYFQDETLIGIDKKLGFGIPVVLVYLLLNLVSHVYFTEKNKHWGIIGKLKTLPENEKKWSEKLYGIYHDYVFQLRKSENFLGRPRNLLDRFNQFIIERGKARLKEFPQNPLYVGRKSRVPKEFELKRFSHEGQLPEGSYRWIYFIPNSFYRKLHQQVLLVTFVTVSLFIIIAFLSPTAYMSIGSPALLIISFSCWIGLYIAIIFLDFAIFRPRFKRSNANKLLSAIPLRFLILVLLLFSSYYNDDHPVRYNSSGTSDTRPPLREHFTNWYNKLKQDSLNTRFCVKDSADENFYPVVFICAEGGALRTGAYTALTLCFLQDTLEKYQHLNLNEFIYAFSGVSGGSLGVSFYNAESFLNHRNDLVIRDSLIASASNFFSTDFLAPVIGKMFYGEILNLLLPWHIEKFDRAIALEKAWEEAYLKVVNSKSRNYFSADYLSIYGRDHSYPALFINTTEVETGRQCWLTNVKPDSTMFLHNDRDLFDYRLRDGINYSTMINFSSRFPLFSPAAAIKESDAQKFHYVDGGYVENTGEGTMTEILRVLRTMRNDTSLVKGGRFKPYVIALRFGDENNTFSNINFGNEIMEILSGIYNTRGSRSEIANEELHELVDSMGGKIIPMYLSKSNSQVPMNWVLSDRSTRNVLDDVKKKWKDGAWKNLFAVDGKSELYSKCTMQQKTDTMVLKEK